MRVWKRLIIYLILNILISAATVLAVLSWWEGRGSSNAVSGTPVVIIITATPPDSLTLNILPIVENTVAETPLPASENYAPTPTVEVVVYYVQVGDTLGTIAEAYDIRVADILAVNDIDDPDQLYVGQLLYIPTAPLPTQLPPATITPTSEPSPTATMFTTQPPQPTPTPTTIGEPAGMQIVTVIGAGDIDTEKVVLKRTGGGELSLSGWQLTDQDGHIYTFPQLTLYQDGAVNVYSRFGQDTVVDLYWGRTAAIWQAGETVTLYDALGEIRASFTIP